MVMRPSIVAVRFISMFHSYPKDLYYCGTDIVAAALSPLPCSMQLQIKSLLPLPGHSTKAVHPDHCFLPERNKERKRYIPSWFIP